MFLKHIREMTTEESALGLRVSIATTIKTHLSASTERHSVAISLNDAS
ncbi:hypothetical protein [Limnobaculum parvum]|nr:hypothetical protein [Limnobaculum parvum]